MAVEVADSVHFFKPLSRVLDITQTKRRTKLDSSEQPHQETLFKFFTLHDVESVWWLLTFALFSNGVKDIEPNETREE